MTRQTAAGPFNSGYKHTENRRQRGSTSTPPLLGVWLHWIVHQTSSDCWRSLLLLRLLNCAPNTARIRYMVSAADAQSTYAHHHYCGSRTEGVLKWMLLLGWSMNRFASRQPTTFSAAHSSMKTYALRVYMCSYACSRLAFC